MLAEARLTHQGVRVTGTPRRLVVYVEKLAGRQADEELVFRGPPANRSFDAEGQATPAAVGFARSKGVDVADLVVREADGGSYVFAVQRLAGQPAMAVLPDLLAKLVAGIRFEKSMRWDSDGIAFSRPLRWLVALFGEHVVPFSYAKAQSGRTSRGLRLPQLAADRDPQRRRVLRRRWRRTASSWTATSAALIQQQLAEVAASMGGVVSDEPALLDEVTDLVEQPAAILGSFEERYLSLPADVLTTVMKKHQRYFPVVGKLVDREIGRLVDRLPNSQVPSLPTYQFPNLPIYQFPNLPIYSPTSSPSPTASPASRTWCGRATRA